MAVMNADGGREPGRGGRKEDGRYLYIHVVMMIDKKLETAAVQVSLACLT